MTDNIANIFLTFGHDTIIVPLVILGYIWFDRKIFYSAICLGLLNMIFNAALKVTFKIPLDPSLNKDWFAFPSGHMQNVVILYCWLMAKIQKGFINIIGLIILIGEAWALVHFGYHNYYDILGAIIFGSILLLVYQKFLYIKIKEPALSLMMFFCGSIMMVYIAYVYYIRHHLWVSFYGFVGIIISEIIFSKLNYLTQESLNNKLSLKWFLTKVIATIVCFGAILLIKFFFQSEYMSSLPNFTIHIQWALISFCIPLSLVVSKFINNLAIKKFIIE